MGQSLTVKPGDKIRLADFKSDHTGKQTKESVAEETAKYIAEMSVLADRLYAEKRRSLLLVLQGMDTSGKDGTIRHVLTGVSPLACQIMAFKQPGAEELDHDFLWRIHQHVPARGCIGIFNRSHYEDVLVVRVLNLVPKEVWKERYDQINEFEKLLTETGTRIVKVCLLIGKDEQKRRLQERLDDPHKRWKFSKGDLVVRKQWDEYQDAYDSALTKCNTDYAPWYVVPADNKWYRNYVVSKLLRDTLAEMDPQYPPAEPDLDKIVIE
jgi:PPK2 family polyphosphate:nucleotide phosphotransferase